jgi:Tetratricopeptide repeat.
MRKHTLFAFIFGIAFSCTATSNLMAQSVENYESLMESGNEKYAAKDYFSAKTYFEMALKQKVNDATAQKRLNETLTKIREDNEKQEIFYGHLDQGDALYNQKKYEEALNEYNNALSIFPNDKYVTAQANAIRAILQERQAKIDDFNLTMAQGISLMESENYDAAILQFQNAGKIFPDDDQPKQKLAEATQLQQAYNERFNQFNTLTKEANELSLRKSYDAALGKLNEALAIFPDNEDVKNQITALTTLKTQSDQYNVIIAEADKLYENKSYKESKGKYQEALSVAPKDAYANDMIQRINQLFESPEYIAQENYLKAIEKAKEFENQSQIAMALSSFEEALTYKPQDDFATQKIAELSEYLRNETLKAEIEQNFIELLAKAEKAEKDNELNDALTFYMDASEMKPENEMAKNKVIALQKLIQNLEEADKQYAQYIADADKLFNSQSFESAITAYTNALSIKPDETYPQQQIQAAETNISELAAAAERQEKVNGLLTQAEQLFAEKDYEASKNIYMEVKAIDNANAAATARINEIENLLAQLAQEKQQKYDEAMSAAEQFMAAQNFIEAITQYEIALENKPNDANATAQLAAAQKSESDRIAALRTKYNRLIKEADGYFKNKEYDKAIDFYTQAQDLQLESYPSEMIAQINQIMEDHKLIELNESPILLLAGKNKNLISNQLRFHKGEAVT